MAKHILVLDNREDILHLYEAILHDEAGYKVTRGTNRPRIIESIKELKPDLVITDLMYGEEVAGWQLIDMMKMDRETADIPIVVCTGAVNDVKEREGLMAEKNVGIVFKPFDIDELLLAVKLRLGG